MNPIKIAVWNMEWMNDLFVSNDQAPAFKADEDTPAHSPGATIRQRRDDLSGVLEELDVDVVVVVEGPNRSGELQLFFDEDMPGTWQTWVQPTKGQSQLIGVAVRTDQGKFAPEPLQTFDTNDQAVFAPFPLDIDEDGITEQYKFERKPLYVAIRLADGTAFRIAGLHLKSKGVFGAYEWSKWWQIADANRKKILAQATHLRLNFLDAYLQAPDTQNVPLIVCGDINDGPGLDASEKRLFGSGVERLMGSVWCPETSLGNALFDSLSDKDQRELRFSKIYTASFADPIFNNTYHRVWIDHLLYTNNINAGWVTDAQVHIEMEGGLKMWKKYPHASDHFPITAKIQIPA